jgi:hypothetical protein
MASSEYDPLIATFISFFAEKEKVRFTFKSFSDCIQHSLNVSPTAYKERTK